MCRRIPRRVRTEGGRIGRSTERHGIASRFERERIPATRQRVVAGGQEEFAVAVDHQISDRQACGVGDRAEANAFGDPDQPDHPAEIGTGALNEFQSLDVHASSGNPSLIPIPKLTYTSPNRSAVLSFEPRPNVQTSEFSGYRQGNTDEFNSLEIVGLVTRLVG